MPVAGGQLIQAWRAEHFRDGIRYRIDVNHPAVKAVLDDAGSLAPQIKAMLRIIEETIPVQTDMAGHDRIKGNTKDRLRWRGPSGSGRRP